MCLQMSTSYVLFNTCIMGIMFTRLKNVNRNTSDDDRMEVSVSYLINNFGCNSLSKW